MLLAVDVGNTHIVLALYDGKEFLHNWRLQTRKEQTEDEFAAALRQLFLSAELSFKDVHDVVLCSVVPDVSRNLDRLFKKYFNIEAHIVSKDSLKNSLTINVDRPGDVGADRLVNSIAAQDIISAPFIVIDFGTATTFDVVDASNTYIGGAIAPGVNLSVKALYEAAAKLPDIEIVKPSKAIGDSTVSAMQSGVFWGYTGLINDILNRIKSELDGEANVLATGGLAGLFADEIEGLTNIDENLTLKGLVKIHEMKYKKAHVKVV